MTEPLLSSSARHLSDDEIDGFLIDSGSADLNEHVTGCELCRNRVEAFRSSMGVFNQASLAWAEAKSNTLTRELTAGRSSTGWNPGARWSVAAALILGALLGVSSSLHHRSAMLQADKSGSAETQIAAGGAGDSPSQTELAQDNAFLRAVNSEMAPVTSPVALYEGAAQTGVPETGVPQTNGPRETQSVKQERN